MKLAFALLLVTLSGCGMVRSIMEEPSPPEVTLASLEPINIPEEKALLPQLSLQELAEFYREVLPLTDDPKIRLLVQHRLADIEMLSGEEKLVNTGAQGKYFVAAISAYEQLLAENPDSAVSDQFLYQLSKAYELSGDSKKSLATLERLSANHPDSWYLPEAEFRRAESYFVAGDYARAEVGYTSVLEYGERSPYYSKSLYMQGWSRFKQGQYNSAVASFTLSLDQLIPKNGKLDTLNRGNRELVEDSFRILAVIFSYLGGPESIAIAYDRLGVRDYQYLFYRELGDLYLEQQRYRDSAEAYKAYSLRFPGSKEASQFQLRVIAAYESGAFPALVVEEKQYYVEMFAQESDDWVRSNWTARNKIDEKLTQFIPELAQYFHALAQRERKIDANSELALQHYQQAATYYQLYVEYFPNTSEVPRMGFLLAESQFEAGDYHSAIVSYEWVAYHFIDYEKAQESAYSAILTYEKLTDPVDITPGQIRRSDRVNSELRFAATFPDDSRAASVLGHAASGLFERAEYNRSIKAATKVVDWQPEPAMAIILPARLVLGHSYFELGMFQVAEEAYQGALLQMPQDDERYEATRESLAASVYKQAEEAVAKGHYARAAQEFSRVIAVAPASEIRVNAQFDAAQNNIKAGDFVEANRLLSDFRKRYPDHLLTSSVALVMVGNYEKLGAWGDAARELDRINSGELDPEEQRNILYLSAQYYDKSGDSEQAILRYRRYAHAYEEPFLERMEAMSRLSDLYRDAKEDQKRRFWLNKIIVFHDSAENAQTERSLFLAASASSVFADDAYQAYKIMELRTPLKKSLKKKKLAMEKTVAAYNKTNMYGIQKFSTLATYRLARVYQDLGSALLASQRPSGLNQLELEQYELLLEEQAFPFEEKAIAIYQTNVRRSWQGIYDQWVRESFVALGELMPARYAKMESNVLLGEDIY